MSNSVFYTTVFYTTGLRTVLIVIVSLMLAIGGWVSVQPRVTVDAHGPAPLPALAEGHEGDFGG